MKASPAPWRTMTRTASSFPAAFSASSSACASALLSALRTAGRFSVIDATPFATDTRTGFSSVDIAAIPLLRAPKRYQADSRIATGTASLPRQMRQRPVAPDRDEPHTEADQAAEQGRYDRRRTQFSRRDHRRRAGEGGGGIDVGAQDNRYARQKYIAQRAATDA